MEIAVAAVNIAVAAAAIAAVITVVVSARYHRNAKNRYNYSIIAVTAKV